MVRRASIFGSVLLTCQIFRIMPASVQESIVFSHKYNETFYQLVIEGKSILPADTNHKLSLCLLVCALGPDLVLLPNGN